MPTSDIARANLAALDILNSLTPGVPLTEQQRTSLLSWLGWGPLAKAFERHLDPEWAEVADRLAEQFEVNPTDLTTAAEHVDTSFYTPPQVMDSMFNLLHGAGFTDGTVLELGCGSGRFIATTPSDMNIAWTGVESDPTSARIAALLNPDATIIAKPLQTVSLASNSFDAAIGNIPFATSTVWDSNYPSASLHEYFLLRAIDAVRPGGFIFVVTSRYVMDSERTLSKLQADADLIGAVRLPSGMFNQEGTGVVADVVLFRKRSHDQPLTGWNDEAEHAGEPRTDHYGRTTPGPRRTFTVHGGPDGRAFVHVNRYWEAHPDHVAGVMHASGFDRSPLRVVSTTHDADAAAAFTHLARVTPTYTARSASTDPTVVFADVTLADNEGRPEGSFHIIDGTVVQIVNGTVSPVSRAGAELRALIELRDAAQHLLSLESDPDLPDAAIDTARTTARTLYDRYVAKYGALNRGTLSEGKPDPETGLPTFSWRRPAMGGFRRDPGYVLVLALETFNQDTGDASAAPILLRRVNHLVTRVDRVETAHDALALTLAECGRVDLDRIAELLELSSIDDVRATLGDLLFTDPATGTDIAVTEYLSGNVRAKLDTAIRAAEADPAFARNVAALTAALPPDLGPADIRANLGAPWITPDDVTQFISDVLGQRSPVHYSPAVAVWELPNRKWSRVATDIAMRYGTKDMDPLTLVEYALNGRQPVVYDTVWTPDGTGKKVRNNDASLAAAEKLAALNERFSVWLWEDRDRADRVSAEYNRRFNSYVARRYDGTHLTFPGLSDQVNLWQHQRDGVARIIASERTLIGHAVGSGKTLTAVASALQLRHLGLANKPLLIVPNHLLEQIAREAQQAYPTGRFLIASKEDLAGDARRLFAARCATGDWDAVVMTHQAFGSLAVAPEVEEAWLQEQKAIYRQMLSDDGSGRGAKVIASMLRTFDKRIAELRATRVDPKQVLFDHLGIDFIAVDEFHMFKRLSTPTSGSSRNEGFSMGASKRATDLLLKLTVLAEQRPGKPVFAGFTGTPWSNTLAETFVWQTYLQPDRLAETGVASFPAWAATFVRFEDSLEVAPDGSGFRIHRRPAAIQNVPELRAMLDEVADLLPPAQLHLDRPDSVMHNVVVEPGPQQLAAVAALAERADNIRRRSNDVVLPDGRTDNMLLICGDGRRLALDPILVGVAEDSAKLNEAADTIARIYHDNKHTTFPGSTVQGVFQMAFCDQGTPHGTDWQTYGRLRTKLVERGIPADRIRAVHEAKTAKAREALFASCRSGDVAVLLGSTETLGTGTNAQRRLRALHHIDAPWRPSDIEQREGRALRPGNLNPVVDIYRYVTTRTFDAYMWQTLVRKASFVAQLFTAKVTERELEDVGDVVLSFNEVRALAAGNPMLLEQAGLTATVKRLRIMQAVHRQSVNAARKEAETLRASAQSLRDRASRAEEALTALSTAPLASKSQIDAELAALARLMHKIRAREDYLRGSWRDLSLTPNLPRTDRYRAPGTRTTVAPLPNVIDIDVQWRYSTLFTVALARRDLRRGDDHAASKLNAALMAQVDDLAGLAENARARAARMVGEADRADAAAEAAVFEEQAELDDAVARLARVTAAIEVEASERAA